jgi:GntR family transcriptional repressor for pyruvate dehydrogenase complex
MQAIQTKGIIPQQVVSADLMFHRTIFRATGNALASRLFHTIHSAMFKMIAETSQTVQVEHTVRFHRAILEAIERRDSTAAAACMTEHLIDARDLILHNQKRHETLRLRKHLFEGRDNRIASLKRAVGAKKKSRTADSVLKPSTI